jgi:hypothetical protein
MREYSRVISLTRNSRGIYSLDPSIGCNSGMSNEFGGCFGECYAAKSAKLYGYDFSKTVYRDFKDEKHRHKIVDSINRIKLDFIRIGTSGDPSEDWNHTVKIIKGIDKCNKQIVIITKHWTNLTSEQLEYFGTINVCVNTSVSAIDKPYLTDNSLAQYELLKSYCKSILRVVSADFNTDNPTGRMLANRQEQLFTNENTLDTVLRVNKRNSLVSDGVIKVTPAKFLGKNTLVSKYRRNTYFGKCATCHEMCGINIKIKNKKHPNKKGIIKQLDIFKNKQT